MTPNVSLLPMSTLPSSPSIQPIAQRNMMNMTPRPPVPQPNYNMTSGFNNLNISSNVYATQQNNMFQQFQQPPQQQQAQSPMLSQQFLPQQQQLLQPQQQQLLQPQQQQTQQLQPQRPPPALPQFGKPQTTNNPNSPLNSIQVPW